MVLGPAAWLVASAAPVPAQTAAADLILTNARVYTFAWGDPGPEGTPVATAPFGPTGWRPDAEAVAVANGAIVFVGSARAAQAYRGPATRVLDLRGATLLPGLIDSHTHIANLGAALTQVNLVGVATEAEAVERVAAYAAKVPEGEWVLGQGWDEGAWANHYPDMTLLSTRVPDHPVYLRGLHSFAVWGNRLAFERAGITATTPAPEGGEIRRDAAGRPTGVLTNRATQLLERAIPPPTQAQLREQLTAALGVMAQAGYVAVHEAGVDSAHLEALTALEREGKLPLRVYAMILVRGDETLARRWLARGPDRDHPERLLRVRAAKAFYDGALGSRGARLLADYSDRPGYRGLAGANFGFNRQLMADLMRAGFQVSIHAIGDAGNRETLDFFESVYATDPGTRSQRNRIEHAQVVSPGDFARFARDSIVASMEPSHAVEDKAWAEERVGPERIKGAYAWRTMRRAGVRLTFNSDLPGTDYNIFYGLHSAVTRQGKDGEPGGGWYPEQRMTPEEALRGFTAWAAYAAFVERETGVLQAGRWADLTAVDIDPLVVGSTDPGKLLGGRVLLTVVGGRIVYQTPER